MRGGGVWAGRFTLGGGGTIDSDTKHTKSVGKQNTSAKLPEMMNYILSILTVFYADRTGFKRSNFFLP